MEEKSIFSNSKFIIVFVVSLIACLIDKSFVAIFLFLMYIIYLYLLERTKRDKEEKRLTALEAATIYLEPYNKNNVLGNLKLTNKFCTIYLHRNEIMIGIKENIAPYRECLSPRCDREHIFNTWNSICRTFSHSRKYEDLVIECELLGIPTEPIKKALPLAKNKINYIAGNIDINNCSIIEITNLPGINIVLAKRIIQKREEIGGFKTTKEFFEFINLKPHFIKQIQNQIYINKMKGTLNIKQTAERSVDF